MRPARFVLPILLWLLAACGGGDSPTAFQPELPELPDVIFNVTAEDHAALVIASQDLVERILPGMEGPIAAEIGPSLALLPGTVEIGIAVDVWVLTQTLATALASLEARFGESPDNVHLSVIRLVLDELDARLEVAP